MSLYEKMLESAASGKDSGVRSLFLGWKGSAIILEDGRWGVGAVPPSERDSHSPREPHTRLLLSATAREIALLAVSPYPQEFAAASAALSALLPPTEGGCPLEALLSLPGEERVSLLSPDPWVSDFLRDWNWNLSIFDDRRRGLAVLPEWTSSQHMASSPWIWLTAEALRTRAILTLLPLFPRKKGVILQGPGIPYLPELFREAGVTHLVLPVPGEGSREEVFRYLGTGGSPWSCPDLRWRVFFLKGEGNR
ncbi:hypothetical protein MASR2M17_11000 [Aminivibrio sp.]